MKNPRLVKDIMLTSNLPNVHTGAFVVYFSVLGTLITYSGMFVVGLSTQGIFTQHGWSSADEASSIGLFSLSFVGYVFHLLFLTMLYGGGMNV